MLKIVFMGTPDFAVPALKSLHESSCEIMRVITQPDRPKGRGRRIFPPPIKTAAIAMGDTVIQPDSVKTAEFKQELESLEADLFVVVAFGHILPESILKLPRLGSINIHASLLPKYRGPAPIQRAIINCEKETGVTIMMMDAGMDTGDIILSEKIDISPDDTAGTLHNRLADMGAKLLKTSIRQFETGKVCPHPQDHTQATYAPMLNKQDGRIDWNLDANVLEPFIRGMNPWPCAFTFYGENRLKIFRAKTAPLNTGVIPGTVIKGFSDELLVAAGKNALSILDMQIESGKRLLIKDFLRGYQIPEGTRFI